MEQKFVYLPIKKLFLNIDKILYVTQDNYVQMVDKKYFILNSQDITILKNFI